MTPTARWARFGLYSAIAFTLCTARADAQAPTPGQNINMVSGTQWPGGDPFLQRQNEPSIAVSTRNPRHVLAGANDYRTVDLNALVTGETGDAWLGVFKSFDGGATWQSTLLPGYPLDQTPEGMASPLKGFNAASDPVVRAGTNGLFFYTGIAFNRSLNSGVVFVSRFIDLNNKENGNATTTTINSNTDPIRYIGALALDKGNSGQFLDKPWVAVDIPRAGAGTCSITVPEIKADGTTTQVTQTFPAGNVYVAWARFVGNDNTIRSKIYFSRSTDCGTTWSMPILLSQTYAINQGVSVAADPGTGAVYVAWRTFAAASTLDGVAVAKSTDGGQTFTKGIQVRTLPAFDPNNPAAGSFFDENSLSTNSGGPQIRTLAFPSMAIDGCGQIYLAWSQRTPLANGDARIFMATSMDGLNWSPPFIVDNASLSDDLNGGPFSRGHQLMPQLTFAGGKLMMLYYDLRYDHTLGAFTPANTTNPFTTDGYPNPDSHGRLVLEQRVGIPDSNVFTPFLNDAGLLNMRHTLEARVAQFSPAGSCPTGPVNFTTARVSQYPFGTRGDLSPTIQQLSDNPPNLPMFQGGITPFLGDYVDIAGSVFTQSGGSWIYNTSPAASPVHIATWTDNRDVQPPPGGDWTHYTPVFSGPSIYDPTQTRPACDARFTASRNQNIYSSRITQGLTVSSPQNSKPLSANVQRQFVVLVQNTTGLERNFRLTIGNQPSPSGFASFVAGTNNPPNPPTPPVPLVTMLDVTVGPHGGVARPVFAVSSNSTASIEVDVAEINAPGGTPVTGGLSSFLILNQDGTVPTLIDPDGAPSGTSILGVEVYNPNVSSPNVSSPNVSSPNVSSPNVSSPNVSSPNVSSPNVSSQGFAAGLTNGVANPNVSSPNVSSPNVSSPNVSSPNVSSPNVSSTNFTTTDPVSDGNYTVTNNGNTSASYHIQLVSSQPVTTPLQLLVNKVYATPVAAPGTCGSLGLQQTNIPLANVNNPPIVSPGSFNPSNTGITDSSVTNTTFSLAPGETALLTLRGAVTTDVLTTITQQVAPVVIAHAANTNDPTNTPAQGAPLFITTVTLPDGTVGASYNQPVTAIGGTPPYTWSVSSGDLSSSGLNFNSSSGVIFGTPTVAGTFNFTVQATDAISQTASRALSVVVFPPPDLIVESYTHSPLAPTTADLITFTAVVKNIGAGPAGPSTLLFKIGGETPGAPQTLYAVPSLQPGQTFTRQRQLVLDVAQAYRNTATADYFNVIFESSETNNTTLDDYSVVVPPPPPPASLVFVTQPSNTTVSQTMLPAVQVLARDSTGAAVSGVNVTLAIGTNPAGAVLGGTTTVMTDSTGTATFSNLNLNQIGTGYTLVANATDVPSTTSNTFEIRPIFSGSVTDPPGDITGTNGDLISANLTTAVPGLAMQFEVHFAAGTFVRATTEAEFLLDTDQNAATGHKGDDSGCSLDNTIIGSEFLVVLRSDFAGDTATIFKNQPLNTCNAFVVVGTVPVTILSDGMRATVPLSMLGNDDGFMNFKVTSDYSIGTNIFSGIVDIMPDVGMPVGQTFELGVIL